MSTQLDDVSPAVALRFGLSVEGRSLGAFTGVKGLVVEHEVLEWAEGGQNAYVHRLPGRQRYRDITLTRLTDRHTAAVAAWVDEVRRTHVVHTGAITAYDSDEQPVATWELRGVWPLRYTGPVLDTAAGGVARETLELAHSGFTVSRA